MKGRSSSRRTVQLEKPFLKLKNGGGKTGLNKEKILREENKTSNNKRTRFSMRRTQICIQKCED